MNNDCPLSYSVDVTAKKGHHFPHKEIRLISEEFLCESTNTLSNVHVRYTFLEECHAVAFGEVVKKMFSGTGKPSGSI